jgi:hypothetical protein
MNIPLGMVLPCLKIFIKYFYLFDRYIQYGILML